MPLSALFVGAGWRCDFVAGLGVVWSYGRHGSGPRVMHGHVFAQDLSRETCW